MPIAHCLLWPDCVDTGVEALNLAAVGTLTFAAPDLSSFPCLGLAKRALQERGGQAVVLNAANEAAVALFLEGRIGFMDIPALIEQALDAHAPQAATHEAYSLPRSDLDLHDTNSVLDAIMALDATTRRQVQDWVGHK